jgi:hypothetical protein
VSPLAFAVHVAALVIAVSGARKIVDAEAVTAALRAAGWWSHPVAGRLVGAVELAVGTSVLALGGVATAAGLVAVYAGFIGFIESNRLRDLYVPCGCFGRSDAPPGLGHRVVNVGAVAVGAAAVVRPVDAATSWLDHGATGTIALVGIVVGAATIVVGLDPSRRSNRT